MDHSPARNAAMDRLDELALFLAIADAGSLAGAGRRLGRSPPAVTRILADLERRLGVRLVERTTRRLALTDAGLRLAGHARPLVAAVEGAVRDTAGGAPGPPRPPRVSAPPPVRPRPRPPLLPPVPGPYPPRGA